MPWKKGKVRLDDGTTYEAELLVNSKGQVYNARIYKENGVVEEVDAHAFASKLGKTVESVYPYTFELDE